MTTRDKKYYVKNQSNQLVAGDDGAWCLPESIHAREFARDELIDFKDEEYGIDVLTYYDNTVVDNTVVIGWAEADDDCSFAVAIPVK